MSIPSAHLVALVAEPHILPVLVHLVHSDTSAGCGVLDDARLGDGAPGRRQAGCVAVVVVETALLGGSRGRAAAGGDSGRGVKQAAVAVGRARATRHRHSAGLRAGRQLQPEGRGQSWE